jgi:hypothetical protein
MSVFQTFHHVVPSGIGIRDGLFYLTIKELTAQVAWLNRQLFDSFLQILNQFRLFFGSGRQ